MDILGRFTIAEITADYLAVGFVGSAWAEKLTPAQVEYICGFYGMSGKCVEVFQSYPVKLNRTYNDFLLIYWGD